LYELCGDRHGDLSRGSAADGQANRAVQTIKIFLS
jgi:hypothetical protein